MSLGRYSGVQMLRMEQRYQGNLVESKHRLSSNLESSCHCRSRHTIVYLACKLYHRGDEDTWRMLTGGKGLSRSGKWEPKEEDGSGGDVHKTRILDSANDD